jgi:hypothetical protein
MYSIFSGEVVMARIISVFQIELLAGVDPQEFIRFINDQYAPMAARINWTGSVGLADRGLRKGKLALIWEFDNQAQRDIAIPVEDGITETALKLLGPEWDENGKIWSQLVESATSSDYVLQE